MNLMRLVCCLAVFYIFPSKLSAEGAPFCNSAIIQNTPDSRYKNNGDGTVSDLPTGLMWQKCTVGLFGADCASGRVIYYTWSQALQYAENINLQGGFAGYNNWRLPNLNELESLVNDACRPPINNRYFPKTPISNFWSSSPDLYSLAKAWQIEFSLGYTQNESRSRPSGHVRLVRDGE